MHVCSFVLIARTCEMTGANSYSDAWSKTLGGNLPVTHPDAHRLALALMRMHACSASCRRASSPDGRAHLQTRLPGSLPLWSFSRHGAVPRPPGRTCRHAMLAPSAGVRGHAICDLSYRDRESHPLALWRGLIGIGGRMHALLTGYLVCTVFQRTSSHPPIASLAPISWHERLMFGPAFISQELELYLCLSSCLTRTHAHIHAHALKHTHTFAGVHA